MPVLWKYDKELGWAYFCPHCKTLIMMEEDTCPHCGGSTDWSRTQQYTGKVKWY
nr:hypothetical protein [uncultured Aminipila sp.]